MKLYELVILFYYRWCMFVFCFVVEMIFFIIYVFIEFGVLIMYILKDILYYLFINLYFGVNMINIILINICRFFVY